MSLLSVIFLCSLIASIPLSLSLSLPCFYKKSQHSHEGQVSGASLHLHEDNELYHDEDGSTTQEINVAFVRGTRKQITLLIAVSFVGLAVNTAAAIVVEAGRDHALLRSGHSSRWWLFERSIRVVAAVFLAFQSLIIAQNPSSISRQSQGVIAGSSFIFFYAANLWYDLHDVSVSRLQVPFFVTHLLLMAVSIWITWTIPRRPQVFHQGQLNKAVDGERTVSLLSRLTLSWANPKLSYALRKGGIDFEDLCYLTANVSTNALVSNFSRFKAYRLWKTIALAHRSVLFCQWILTLFTSVAVLAPQYFMWRLIQALEQSSPYPEPIAGLWLALLGFAQLLQPWIEAWVLWVGWCHIALPINMQLSGLIVAKTMRKKNVSDARHQDEDFQYVDAQKRSDPEPKADATVESKSAAGTVPLKTKQDEINLISVDVQRVSDFMSYNGMIMGVGVSLIISVLFLLSFIRLPNILIGVAGVILFVPLNIFAKRRYSKSQDELMNARDLKAATITEALLGIRQVKFDATELHWSRKIRYVRNIELSKQWKAYLAETLLVLCWIGGPTMFAAITLSAVSLLEKDLPPSVAFTALAIFQRLESTLSLVPGLLTDFVNAWISFGRIEEFLKSPERLDATVDADSISFQNAAVTWPSDENNPESFVLQNLSFTIPKHKLSVIAGPTGSGKSLLLQAVIGEADIIDGIILRPKKDAASDSKGLMMFGKNWIIPKTMAFVTQTAWIENESLRGNILFGLPLSESRYASVLQACALVQDVKTMENGDLAEIGARGINLSGGQRLRLSLARALYSRAEILVIDDVFSAVDAHVGRHILENALTGELIKDRTCIVATHHVQLCLPKANFVVVLGNRTVEYAGFPHEEKGISDFHLELFLDSCRNSGEDHTTQSEPGINRLEEPPLTKLDPTQAKMDQFSSHFDREQDSFIEEEQREKGRVKIAVYKQYLLSVGSWPFFYWLFVVVLLVGFEVALLGRSWWVKIWTDNFKITSDINISQEHQLAYSRFTIQNQITPSTIIDRAYQKNIIYVAGFLGISLLVSILGVIKMIWVFVGSIRASRRQFDIMTSAVLHAPLKWLDTVPVGRILNRFIADFNVIDSKLATDLASLIHYGLRVGGITIAGALVSPWLILCVIPLIATCIAYARMYLAGARDVKRLESIKRSPIYEQFEMILLGISTIRAWNVSQTYLDRMFERIDNHARCTWHMWLFNRWLGIRFAMVGALFTLAVAAFAVYSPNVSASLTGLALAFSLDFSQNVFWVLRRYADVEMDMNSLERVTEFCNLPAEPTEGETPPAHWPAKGRVDVDNLVVGYASDLPPVLCGVSFSCAACTRVGIVGRTGAGKSSLTLAVFRFLEARSGAIKIDGLDISLLSLRELRKRIAIIPQHPVLWLGSIRSNLDPLGEYEDAQLEEVLERVRLNGRELSLESASLSAPSSSSSPPLNDTILDTKNLFTLSTPIAEGGLNISLGQRQLLCLARALLSRPKILIMDEATSAVDMGTDALIQRNIRMELKDCTLLVIAHRLSTVMDFDQIVVLEEGKVVEVGEPKELMAKGKWLRKMAERSGERGALARS